MATTERRIRYTTMGEAMPETTPLGTPPDYPCAVVRDGEKRAVVPYSAELSEMLEPDALDRIVGELADKQFEMLDEAT